MQSSCSTICEIFIHLANVRMFSRGGVHFGVWACDFPPPLAKVLEDSAKGYSPLSEAFDKARREMSWIVEPVFHVLSRSLDARE